MWGHAHGHSFAGSRPSCDVILLSQGLTKAYAKDLPKPRLSHLPTPGHQHEAAAVVRYWGAADGMVDAVPGAWTAKVKPPPPPPPHPARHLLLLLCVLACSVAHAASARCAGQGQQAKRRRQRCAQAEAWHAFGQGRGVEEHVLAAVV